MDKKNLAFLSGAIAAGAFTALVAGSAQAAVPGSESGTSFKKASGFPVSSTLLNHEHECKGKNECKGQGGCKTGDEGCKGKNNCKGHGGCKSKGDATPTK